MVSPFLGEKIISVNLRNLWIPTSFRRLNFPLTKSSLTGFLDYGIHSHRHEKEFVRSMKKDIFNPLESEQSPFKPGTASVDEEVVMDSRLRGNDRGGAGICLICF